MNPLDQYRALEARLHAMRKAHEAEEDALLSEMDAIWYALSDAERAVLNAETSQEGKHGTQESGGRKP